MLLYDLVIVFQLTFKTFLEYLASLFSTVEVETQHPSLLQSNTEPIRASVSGSVFGWVYPAVWPY